MEPGLYAPVRFDQLMRLDEWTPDGRFIASEGFGTRNLPRPIYLHDEQGPGGHVGAKVAGRLDEVHVHADGVVSGRGWLLDDEVGRRAALLLSTKAVTGNSVDLADVEYDLDFDGEDIKVRFTKANIGATTIVGIPAFPEATAALDDLVRADEGREVVASFADTSFSVATAAKPTVGSVDVPMEWFVGSEPRRPYPLTVEADGRVHGYLAVWDHEHLSVNGRVRAPRGRNYPHFNASAVLTPEGLVNTGPLVIGGDHAGPRLSWTDARDHYAATSLAWADVHASDDRHGIRLNGAVRTGAPDEAIAAGRASRLSGDWRRIDGHMQLVAALSVNTPAFPVAREFASSEPGLGSLVMFAPDFPAEDVQDASLLALRGRVGLSRLRMLTTDVGGDHIDV